MTRSSADGGLGRDSADTSENKPELEFTQPFFAEATKGILRFLQDVGDFIGAFAPQKMACRS